MTNYEKLQKAFSTEDNAIEFIKNLDPMVIDATIKGVCGTSNCPHYNKDIDDCEGNDCKLENGELIRIWLGIESE